MNRASNNVLPNNLQLLYKSKSCNGVLFHRIKVRTDQFIKYRSNSVEQITTQNKKHY